MSCVSHVFASVHCFLVVTCWERAEVAMFIVFFLLSHVVFWVRCDTCLYHFLIFAIFVLLINYLSFLLLFVVVGSCLTSY